MLGRQFPFCCRLRGSKLSEEIVECRKIRRRWGGLLGAHRFRRGAEGDFQPQQQDQQ